MLFEHIKGDKLTNLPYYEDFLSAADEQKRKNPSAGKGYVLISADIANFKFINRIYGYEAGDTLIKSLASNMTNSIAGCIVACRPYSDHIIGLYSKNVNREHLTEELRSLNSMLVDAYSDRYQSVTLHLHIGIYMIENGEESIVSCIDKANIARRSMKGDYSVSGVFFNEAMYKGKEKTSEIISLFDSALKNNRIIVYLQPKIFISDKTLSGAEALSRIQLEDGNIMAPGEYIQILEKSGRIIELDKYIMKSVFSLINDWLRRGVEPVPISINLSRIHFYDERMVEGILDIYNQYDISSRYIEFEVTESAFFAECELITEKLLKLQKLGFKVSMDDFGTGYSTLHSLAVLPIDTVKFDRSFIKSSMNNAKGMKVLGGLISLCKQIEFDVICEGVETTQEEEVVRDCGCESVQGYVYDKPIPINEFIHKYIMEDTNE